MKIYSADGFERNWEWVREKYNLPEIIRAPKDEDHWEMVELRERIGPVAMRIRMVGLWTLGIHVRISWPDGHVMQATNREGYTDFVLDAYYRPPKVGPYAVQVSISLQASDVVEGLGMLGKTNHAHLEPTFQFIAAEEPGPGPGECQECKRKDAALSEVHRIVVEALG